MIKNIDYAHLTLEHPERQNWRNKWPDYRLAYKGGYEFLSSAGMAIGPPAGTLTAAASLFTSPVSLQTPRRRFLRQLEGEPNAVYASVWDRAYYVNYLGGILDYYRHYLFSQPPNICPGDEEEPPDWWAQFSVNANGSGKSFVEFVRDAFLDVEIERYAGWLIGCNTGVAEPEEGSQDVALTHYRADEILDWQKDACGNLEWVMLEKVTNRREFPEERKEYREYTYIDRSEWQTWQVVTDNDGAKQVKSIASGVHGLDEVPFVMFEIPHGLWITDKLYSWQIDIFNKMVRLGNAQLMGCIIQPFIKSSDPNASSRIFGEGILLTLKSKDAISGEDEDMGWKSPDVSPLQFIADQLDKERDEGYRIVHNMAMAVDATASRMAQSGVSKQEDRKAAEIILCGLGSYVRPVMIRTVNLLSKIYGDNLTWICDGYDNFQVSSLEDELQTASLVSAFGFWSKTAEAELHKKIETGRINDHLDESVVEKIRKEIDDRREQEEELAVAPQVIPGADPNAAVPPEPAVAAKDGMPATPAKPPGPAVKGK